MTAETPDSTTRDALGRAWTTSTDPEALVALLGVAAGAGLIQRPGDGDLRRLAVAIAGVLKRPSPALEVAKAYLRGDASADQMQDAWVADRERIEQLATRDLPLKRSAAAWQLAGWHTAAPDALEAATAVVSFAMLAWVCARAETLEDEEDWGDPDDPARVAKYLEAHGGLVATWKRNLGPGVADTVRRYLGNPFTGERPNVPDYVIAAVTRPAPEPQPEQQHVRGKRRNRLPFDYRPGLTLIDDDDEPSPEMIASEARRRRHTRKLIVAALAYGVGIVWLSRGEGARIGCGGLILWAIGMALLLLCVAEVMAVRTAVLLGLLAAAGMAWLVGIGTYW